MISGTNNVTQNGLYALDAIQNNASIDGTLSNRISVLNNQLLTPTFHDLTANGATDYRHPAIDINEVHGTWVCRIGVVAEFRYLFVAKSIIKSQEILTNIPYGFRPHWEIKFPCTTGGILNQCSILSNGNVHLDFDVHPSEGTWSFIYATYLCRD